MKKSFICVKMAFDSPLHLSRGKTDYEKGHDVIHSDGLKSALFVAGLQLGMDLDEQFFADVRLSSGYPYMGEEYFFPRPMSGFPFRIGKDEGLDEVDGSKKAKKVKFLGKSYFEKMLQGDKLGQAERQVSQVHLHQGGALMSEKLSKTKVLFRKAIQQRVYVPGVGREEDPDPFYLQRIFMEKGAGYFVLLQVEKPTLIPQLKAMFRLLGDQGLGTDRSVGNGQFRFDADVHWIDKFELEVPEEADKQVAMSLYLPLRSEISENFLLGSAYMLQKRGGWLAAPEEAQHGRLRKKSVYMFSEGSVFPHTASDLKGAMVDLKPDFTEEDEKAKPRRTPVSHPVWRDGHALFVPLISFTYE